MKRYLRMLAGGFAALFAAAGLAGCSGTSQSQSGVAPVSQTTGGYVEEDISPDHNYNVGLFAVGDTLHAFTVENPAGSILDQTAYWYAMGPDGQWQEQTDSGFVDLAAQVGDCYFALPQAWLTEQGELYWKVTAVRDDANREGETFYFAVKDGKASQLETPPPGEVALAFDDSTQGMAVCGDVFLTVDSSAVLRAWDAGQKPAQLTLPDWNFSCRLLAGNAEGYYVYNDNGQIQHYILGGTTTETVLDGGRYSLTAPGLSVQQAAVGADDTLYVQMAGTDMTDGSSTLYRYRWDPDLPAPSGGTVTVFSLYENATVEAAANALQKSAGITVEYTYALEENMDDMQNTLVGSREDALTQLNAQLLAGAGPDVLILDDMPVDSLVEKGVLADISQAVSTQDLLPNLAGIWRQGDAVYALPARCFPLLLGSDAETLATIPDAETLAQQLAAEPDLSLEQATPPAQLPVLAYYNTVQLFDTFYPLYADEIWQDGALNEPAYRQFLEMLGEIVVGGGARLRSSADFTRLTGTYYHPQTGTGSCYTNYECRAFCEPVFSLETVGMDIFYHSSLSSGAVSPVGEVKALTTAAGRSCIQPSCIAAVNAAAENKQQAMQFVQTLFSEEVQKQTTVDGVPVLRTAIQSQWDYGFSEYGAESGTDIVQVLEGMKPSLPSTQLRAAAGQGAGEYLAGGSLDEAVNTARQAAELWLAEQ